MGDISNAVARPLVVLGRGGHCRCFRRFGGRSRRSAYRRKATAGSLPAIQRLSVNSPESGLRSYAASQVVGDHEFNGPFTN